MHRSDPELVRACLEGDASAWEQVVDQYGRLVYSIPRRYRFSESDAEDVVQSVFLKLFRKLDTLQDQTKLSAWLITTTHRQCWRIGKKNDRYPHLDEMIDDVSEPDPAEASNLEAQQAVREALRRLGGRCEQLLEMLFLQQGPPSYEAIAEHLGMKEGSIGPTRARCFRKLEAILVDLGFDDLGLLAESTANEEM